MLTDEGKVGSKGELFPPKRIREALGLKKNQKVKYSVIGGKLIVEKIIEPLSLLKQKSKVRIRQEEFKKDRMQLSKEFES
ncbi:MAG: AbrB/MazE/SpoVT family DNA-binding domain-containing protein [Candidatus Hodarchaeales archaeon]